MKRIGLLSDTHGYLDDRMLELLGVRQLKLMTNNPDKIAQLENHGLTVVERVPLILPANPHNARYLATKQARTGHLMDD